VDSPDELRRPFIGRADILFGVHGQPIARVQNIELLLCFGDESE
jgi:hypothetical protein